MINKADKYFLELLWDIEHNGVWDENPRPVWEDGTKAHSKYTTQKTLEFDITKGEFPISTLRNGSLKSAFNELKTIYIDQSNKEEDFIKNGIHWWGSWMNSEGDLGTAYSYNLESLNEVSSEVVEVERRVPTMIKNFCEKPQFEHIFSKTHNSRLSNKVIEGKYCSFRVLDKVSDKPAKYTVQLLDCGNIITVNYSQIRYRNIKSPFFKSIYGVGYYGNYKRFEWLGKYTINKLKEKWSSMLERCYSKNNRFSNWQKDMIDPRWLSFELFIEDCFYIPQFFIAKRENFKDWKLDKDYYGASYYSKHTCSFIKNRENSVYGMNETEEIFKYDHKIFLTYQDLADYMGLTRPSLYHILTSTKPLSNESKIIKDKVVKTTHKFNTLYRYKLSSNQVVELLKNLENDKFSRRHVLSFFNWKDQDKKQLMECAFQNLFSVRSIDGTNYLDQTLTQRSSDFIVAGMINCSQYVMLNMIICNHLKHKTGEDWRPGKFVWFVQNLHIYDRHEWALKEILNKEPVDIKPMIELDCPPKDFFQHTWEDFKISGVEGITPLSKKLEIAI